MQRKVFNAEFKTKVALGALVVFQTWISHQNPKFVSVDKEANNDVMHFVEFGETNCLADLNAHRTFA